MSVANSWLTAMGVPQLQLRDQLVIEVPEAAEVAVVSVAEVEEKVSMPASVVPPPEVNEAAAVPDTVDAVESKPSVVTPPVAAEVVAIETVISEDPAMSMKVIPLLVIWDEALEKTVAGAGSLPSGELGDLLANIVQAVGLTEDVVEAWSIPPDDISNQLIRTGRAPKSIWHFGAGESAELRSIEVAGLQNSVQLITAPALCELQRQKPLKAELWKLLKPLASSGLWR